MRERVRGELLGTSRTLPSLSSSTSSLFFIVFRLFFSDFNLPKCHSHCQKYGTIAKSTCQTNRQSFCSVMLRMAPSLRLSYTTISICLTSRAAQLFTPNVHKFLINDLTRDFFFFIPGVFSWINASAAVFYC